MDPSNLGLILLPPNHPERTPALLDDEIKIFRLKVKYNPTWESAYARNLRRLIEMTINDSGLTTWGSYPRHLRVHIQYSKSRNKNVLDYTGKFQKKVLRTHFDGPSSHIFTSFSPDTQEEARYRELLDYRRDQCLRFLGKRKAKRTRRGRTRFRRQTRLRLASPSRSPVRQTSPFSLASEGLVKSWTDMLDYSVLG